MSTNFETALSNAREFVSKQKAVAKSRGLRKEAASFSAVGQCTAVFLWDDKRPIFEFSIVGKDPTLAPVGYVVTSGDKELPPVFESGRGALLSSQLASTLTALLLAQGEVLLRCTWYYLSPIEIVARVRLLGQQEPVFLMMPSLRVLPSPPKGLLLREPQELWSDASLQVMREQVIGGERDYSRLPTILPNNPVRYAQECSKYPKGCSFSTNRGDTFCAPYCISGCAPVAWAMLASSWKRNGKDGADKKIWRGSKRWNLDWPSSVEPSQSKKVSRSIWRFNKLIGTSCSGVSEDSKVILGGSLFWDQWQLPWKWEVCGGDFATIKKTIDLGQVTMFIGHGEWEKGQEGHCVVAYGYDEAKGSVRVCLGWGYGFADKDIVPGVFGSASSVRVGKFGPYGPYGAEGFETNFAIGLDLI